MKIKNIKILDYLYIFLVKISGLLTYILFLLHKVILWSMSVILSYVSLEAVYKKSWLKKDCRLLVLEESK